MNSTLRAQRPRLFAARIQAFVAALLPATLLAATLLPAAVLLVAAAMVPCSDLAAQTPSRVMVKATFEPATAAPGAEVELRLTLDIDAGYHLYGARQEVGEPPFVRLSKAAGLVAVGETQVPPGEPHRTGTSTQYWLVGTTKVSHRFKVPDDAEGELSIAGVLHSMACTKQMCDPPAKTAFTAALPIVALPIVALPISASSVGTEPEALGAQDQAWLTHGRVSLQARFEPANAAPGDTVKLVVRTRIEDEWHLYGAFETAGKVPEVVLEDDFGLEPVGVTEVPIGEDHEVGEETQTWIQGEQIISREFTIPEDAAAGALAVTGRLVHMACNAYFCEPEDAAPFTAALTVQGPDSVTSKPPTQQNGQGEQGKGFTPQFGESGAGKPPRDGVRAVAALSRQDVRPGEAVSVQIDVTVAEGYHVYGAKQDPETGTAISVAIQSSKDVTAGATQVPDGEPHAKGPLTLHELHGSFSIEQELVLDAGVEPGVRTVKGTLDYQICDETYCYNGEPVRFTVQFNVVEGAARSEFAASAAAGGESGAALWELILGCIGGAILALLMPCTYPMIPITFSFFTKQAEAKGGKVLPLALMYGAGIIAMFVGIGLLVGPAIQAFAAHWVTNLIFGIAFVVFALVLFGFYNLSLPNWMNNFSSKASQRGGVLGVFLMGATLVITSFTCTAPIVGLLLVASKQHAALGMAVFGATMALPFVILALLPGRMSAMPRSGQWMVTLKKALGFVELAAAVKFFSNVEYYLGWYIMPQSVYLTLWVLIFGVCALWLAGVFSLFSKASRAALQIRPLRATFALLFGLLTAYCAWGLVGHRYENVVMSAFLPPYTHFGVPEGVVRYDEGSVGRVYVVDQHETAREMAASADKLLLVNFTGFT